jgi:hypothetical protein
MSPRCRPGKFAGQGLRFHARIEVAKQTLDRASEECKDMPPLESSFQLLLEVKWKDSSCLGL